MDWTLTRFMRLRCMGWRRAKNPNQSMFTSRQVHGHELQKPQSSVIHRNSNIHNNTNGILLFIHLKSFLKSKSYPIILRAILHVLDGWWKNSVFTPQCLMHTQVFWRHSLVYLVSLNDLGTHQETTPSLLEKWLWALVSVDYHDYNESSPGKLKRCW